MAVSWRKERSLWVGKAWEGFLSGPEPAFSRVGVVNNNPGVGIPEVKQVFQVHEGK